MFGICWLILNLDQSVKSKCDSFSFRLVCSRELLSCCSFFGWNGCGLVIRRCIFSLRLQRLVTDVYDSCDSCLLTWAGSYHGLPLLWDRAPPLLVMASLPHTEGSVIFIRWRKRVPTSSTPQSASTPYRRWVASSISTIGHVLRWPVFVLKIASSCVGIWTLT